MHAYMRACVHARSGMVASGVSQRGWCHCSMLCWINDTFKTLGGDCCSSQTGCHPRRSRCPRRQSRRRPRIAPHHDSCKHGYCLRSVTCSVVAERPHVLSAVYALQLAPLALNVSCTVWRAFPVGDHECVPLCGLVAYTLQSRSVAMYYAHLTLRVLSCVSLSGMICNSVF